uniref:Uncharacterized protein n=1 Tax=Anguilla anguilla TaxID=7936 RepID=A0A0E9UGC6_ANGAN
MLQILWHLEVLLGLLPKVPD